MEFKKDPIAEELKRIYAVFLDVGSEAVSEGTSFASLKQDKGFVTLISMATENAFFIRLDSGLRNRIYDDGRGTLAGMAKIVRGLVAPSYIERYEERARKPLPGRPVPYGKTALVTKSRYVS